MALWGAFPDYIEHMKTVRTNDRYLPGVVLPNALRITADREDAVRGADVVVLAPPSKYFSSVVSGFKGLVTPQALVVSITKGLCEKTNRRMTDLGAEILGLGPIVALAGPSHAEEVAPPAKTPRRRSACRRYGPARSFACTLRAIRSASRSAVR